MVRVSLKNTFLTFEEGENSETQRIRESASPRSRSVEAPMSPPRQAEELTEVQLNERFRDLDLSLPPAFSPGGSPPPGSSPRQRSASPQQGPVSSGGYPAILSPLPGDGDALPFDPHGDDPTGTQLAQLQARLEVMYQPGTQRTSERFRHVNSHGSLSSMSHCMSDSGEEGADGVLKRHHLRGRVWSSNSVSTLDGGGSEHADDPSGTVEFNLSIEEEPPAHAAKSRGPVSVADATVPPGSPPPTRLSCGTAVDRKQQQQPVQRTLPKEYRHGHVPKNLDLAEEFRSKQTADKPPPTTLMIRNIPNRYTQRELIVELEALGFTGTFDFLYVPLDKGTMSNVGYAFVNFVDPGNAEKCMEAFQGYRFKRHRKVSGKIAAVSVAHIQGLEANLAHYKNAAVNTAKMKQRRPLVMANISQSLLSAVGGGPTEGIPTEGMSGLQELQM
jgi:hypothetical protein